MYFAMARGYQGDSGDVRALAMKKWFNTNYHYIVPEIEDDTKIKLSGNKLWEEYEEAKALGIEGKETYNLVEAYGFPQDKLLFAGLVNGKNIWKNHYEKTLNTINALRNKGIQAVLSTSCSLLHVPYTLKNESINQNRKNIVCYFHSWKYCVFVLDCLLGKCYFLHKVCYNNRERLGDIHDNRSFMRRINSVSRHSHGSGLRLFYEEIHERQRAENPDRFCGGSHGCSIHLESFDSGNGTVGRYGQIGISAGGGWIPAGNFLSPSAGSCDSPFAFGKRRGRGTKIEIAEDYHAGIGSDLT